MLGAGFLTISALTGLLWAYAPYLYWAGGYKERKHPVHAISLAEAGISLQEVLEKARQRFGDDWKSRKIMLMADGGRLVFRIDMESMKKKQSALLDAESGQWLSPLHRDLACAFARQYVAGKPAIAGADSLAGWTSRTAKTARPAWRVAFADARHTEIFLDPFSGEILEDQDDVRRFHFWIMRIHQLNFFGTRKVLTVINALPLLFLVLTGLFMRRKTWLGRKRARAHGEALPGYRVELVEG